ncbi:MAG TPA: hypothetical protein VI521_00405 [Candidatus Babeliales bacterium]|nr:hypothetical protein [Candidatus Babeliales bacterium]
MKKILGIIICLVSSFASAMDQGNSKVPPRAPRKNTAGRARKPAENLGVQADGVGKRERRVINNPDVVKTLFKRKAFDLDELLSEIESIAHSDQEQDAATDTHTAEQDQ